MEEILYSNGWFRAKPPGGLVGKKEKEETSMTSKFLAKGTRQIMMLSLRDEKLNQFDRMGIKELISTFNDFKKFPAF